ncbi:hypothetical protein GCM10010172_55890 [Paractinoplanes ferrugineus]|uniref:Leucine rich repeat (LRR) protein n=1 Tax=Paractinoplanes ferrugineus TaxID=113564 RepID=A0A919IYT7_9ACTN|nr:hypothetical protein Afe05nite_27800 [Actinoplanes ferrugineus]
MRARVAAAADPAATPSALADLAADPSRSVRRVVAGRPDTPPEALRTLVHDSDRQTRECLARNPGCPPDILIVLLTDPHWSVRWTVLDNPGIDPAKRLDGPDHGLAVRLAAARSDDKDMRYILAQRLGLEDEVIDLLLHDTSAEVRAALAERTDSPRTLESLFADPDPKVRRAAGFNADTTAEQRHRLVSDPAAQVRSAVSEAKSVHGWEILEEDLMLLARDRSVNVRWWLANGPGATRPVYQVLAEDRDESVATAARAWLMEPLRRAPAVDEVAGIRVVGPRRMWGPRYVGEPIPHAEFDPASFPGA